MNPAAIEAICFDLRRQALLEVRVASGLMHGVSHRQAAGRHLTAPSSLQNLVTAIDRRFPRFKP